MFENLKFLNTLDQILLLKYPKVWISKIHYVAFYGISIWLLSALIGLIIPVTPSNTEDIGLWYFLISIISFILFCFWIYRYVVFNNEKKYGIQNWGDSYLNFSLTIICVSFYTLAPVPFSVTYNQRVANFVSDEELFNDINTLNKFEVYMISDQNNYLTYFDSLKQENLFDFRKFENFEANTPWLIRYDTLKYPQLLSAFQQKTNFKLRRDENEIKKAIRTYFEIESKYRTRFKITEIAINNTYQKYLKLTSISPTEGLYYDYFDNNHYELERALSNISEAKFNTLFIFRKEFLTFLMYSIFYSSLLVTLFKLSPWRQYLIAIITIIILPIILFIISQLLPYDSGYRKQNVYSILILITIFVALILTFISFFEKKKFIPIQNISSQISYLTLPVLPLLVLTILNDFFNLFHHTYSASYEAAIEVDNTEPQTDSYFQSKEYFIEQFTNEYWQAQYDLWLNICLFGGVILFLIIINPLMHKGLVKQLSLPKTK